MTKKKATITPTRKQGKITQLASEMEMRHNVFKQKRTLAANSKAKYIKDDEARKDAWQKYIEAKEKLEEETRNLW